MTNRKLPFVCIFALLLASSFAIADEVKLKSGKVIKDVNLIKKTKRFYKFRQINGQEMRVSVDSVVEVIKKETVWDEYKKRKKGLKSKDAEGFFTLAMWAKEQGLKKDWRDALKRALKIDRNHVAANEAAGKVRHKGKWVSKKDVEREKKKAMAADYKARGWKRLGDTFVSPAEITKQKGGWTQHQGHWVDKKTLDRIESKKLVWMEGRWVGPKTMARMKAGERKAEGRWLPIEDLNAMHDSFELPWKINLGRVEIRSIASHQSTVLAAKFAEQTYRELFQIYGEEPDVYGKKGPLVVYLADSAKAYNQFATQQNQTQWEADNSNCFGAWHSSDGGGGVTFYHNQDYLRFWVAYATGLAYAGRLTSEGMLATNLMTAIASYGCYLHKGKFAPTPWFFGRFIQNTKWLDNPNSRGSGMISALTFKGGQLEYPIARGGLFLQFLKQKNPAAFSTSMSRFLLGRASADSLVRKCVGEIKSEMLEGQFENFVRAFIENYKPVKRE